MSALKTYLGDGVFVDVTEDVGAIELTTSNGVATTNRIILEPETLGSFLAWWERVKSRADKEARGG